MRERDKAKGLHTYRHKSNPRERIATEIWAKNLRVLPYLLGDGTHAEDPTDRDWMIAGTLMQWLGSPVGQGFLSELRAAWAKAGLR